MTPIHGGDGAWPDLAFSYAGANVLVAGGTGGIGAGIARAYHAAGAKVTVTGTRADRAAYGDDALASYGYAQLDIEDPASIAALAEAVGECDILVNSTGVALIGLGLDEYDPDNFDRAIRMHLTGAYRLAAAYRDRLANSTLPGGGSFVALASMTSFFAVEVVPGYGAGKAGLVQLVKTLALSWAKLGIRVNAVAAGLTESRMTAGMMDQPDLVAPTLARTPLDRVGTPADMAGPVLFLTSSAAQFITGQTLLVDGGFSVVG